MDGDAVNLLLQQIMTVQSAIQADLSGVRTEVTKAATSLEVIKASAAIDSELHRDHEARIRALERFRFTLAGVAVVGGAVAGLIGALVERVIH